MLARWRELRESECVKAERVTQPAGEKGESEKSPRSSFAPKRKIHSLRFPPHFAELCGADGEKIVEIFLERVKLKLQWIEVSWVSLRISTSQNVLR